MELAYRAVIVWAVVHLMCGVCSAQAMPGAHNRYSCVAAAASLVTQYYERHDAARIDVYGTLAVADDGSASLGRLADVLGRHGLHYKAYERSGPWYIEECLSRYGCCAILVSQVNSTGAKHCQVLFPGRDESMVVADLLGPPQVVGRRYIREMSRGGAIVLVLSDKNVPSLMNVHVGQYSGWYLAGGAVALLVVAAGLRVLRWVSRKAEG